MNNREALLQKLAQLKNEHRGLDETIVNLEEAGLRDHLQIKRLKKRKLMLKDQIAKIEDDMLPDIIA